MSLGLNNASIEVWQETADRCPDNRILELLDAYLATTYPPREVIAEAIVPILFDRLLTGDAVADLVPAVCDTFGYYEQDAD